MDENWTGLDGADCTLDGGRPGRRLAAGEAAEPGPSVPTPRKEHRAKYWNNWLPELNETANFVLPIPLKTTPEPSLRIRKRDRDRAERIWPAGGPKPTLRERTIALVLAMGIVRTRDLTDIGIPRCYVVRMCGEGLLVKVGYGRYRAAVPKAA